MNKVILMGRLTRDPDVKQTQSGRLVARFTLAVDRNISKANRREDQHTADFIGCEAWEKTADFAEKFLAKGKRVLLEGRIQTGSYEAQDGTKRYTTDVIAERIEFADSRRQDDGGEGWPDDIPM